MTQRPKILFIMTHRLGDILQTFPALAQVRSRLPGAQLHYLADDFCAPILELCPWVDKVHALPRTRLVEEASAGEGGFWQANGTLRAALEPMAEERFDRILNWMSAPSAAFLAARLRGPSTLMGGRVYAPPDGPATPEALRSAPLGLGAQAFRLAAAVPAARGWQPFHLSELFAREAAEALGLPPLLLPTLCPADRQRGLDLVVSLGRGMELPRPWLGLQLGASKGVRMAPAEWLKAAGLAWLVRSRGSLFLLGSKEEASAADPLVAALDPRQRLRTVMAAGRTNFTGLAGLLKVLDAVVSVDTLTLHLAAAVGTRSVGLYPAVASPVETGPYGPGHRVLWVQRQGGPCGCDAACEAGSRCWEALSPDRVVAEALDLLGLASAGGSGGELRRLETQWGPQGLKLAPLDRRPLRMGEDEPLAAVARPLALGLPLPEVTPAPRAAGAFRRLRDDLERMGPAPQALARAQDPADWLRVQMMHSLDSKGRPQPAAVETILEACRAFEGALKGRVPASTSSL